MAEKLLAGNETVLKVPALDLDGIPHLIGESTIDSIAAPTVATLNHWAAITKPSQLLGGVGGNLSRAIMDDMTLEQTDSETDGDRVITSVGQSEDPTLYQFTSEMTFLRDADVLGDGTYNLARDVTRAPDVAFIDVHRIGFASDVPFAIGQEVDLYYSWTDNPIPSYGDGANMTIASSAIAKNIIHVNYKLAA